jgi:hypothetical protein
MFGLSKAQYRSTSKVEVPSESKADVTFGAGDVGSCIDSGHAGTLHTFEFNRYKGNLTVTTN